jgi:hypothetical protein
MVTSFSGGLIQVLRSPSALEIRRAALDAPFLICHDQRAHPALVSATAYPIQSRLGEWEPSVSGALSYRTGLTWHLGTIFKSPCITLGVRRGRLECGSLPGRQIISPRSDAQGRRRPRLADAIARGRGLVSAECVRPVVDER